MSQASLTINNVTHAAYRAADNSRAAALASLQSGNAAPANPVAGMFWLDTSTTPATLKQRNTANNAWVAPLLQFAVAGTPDNDTTLPINKAMLTAAAGTSLTDAFAGAPGAPRLLPRAFGDPYLRGAVTSDWAKVVFTDLSKYRQVNIISNSAVRFKTQGMAGGPWTATYVDVAIAGGFGYFDLVNKTVRIGAAGVLTAVAVPAGATRIHAFEFESTTQAGRPNLLLELIEGEPANV